jgi:hypothetical protein
VVRREPRPTEVSPLTAKPEAASVDPADVGALAGTSAGATARPQAMQYPSSITLWVQSLIVQSR